MRFNLKNNVHLEGWAANDIRFRDGKRDSAVLLLAIQTEVPLENGRSEKGRDLIEIELRSIDLNFIPIIRKGTRLMIDGTLRARAGQGEERQLVVFAIRIHSIDWEGYKAEGLKATAGMSEEQTQRIERWGSSALKNRR